MRPGFAVVLVWTCFMVQGAFYASVMPLWDGFDEFSHYAFLEDIALHHRLANPNQTFVSREVAQSLRTAPVPWMIRDWQPDWLSYDRFRQLSETERASRLERLRSIPSALAGETDSARIRNYEAQQPPLAYVILSVPYRLLSEFDLPSRVWALRMFCVLIASALAPFTFLALRETFDEPSAVAGASLAAAFPQIYFDVARVSNEALAVALGAALVWLLIRSWNRTGAGLANDAGIAVLLGCALVTKAYFAPVAIAAIGIIAARCIFRKLKPAACIGRSAFFAAIPAAMAGWWYVRAYRLTGSISGEQTDSSASHSGAAFHTALHAHWLRVADFALLSHIWLGGWSFLVVRTWMYRAIEALFVLAVAGLIFRFTKTGAAVRIAIALEAAFCAGLAAHSVASLMIGGAGAFGYYAFAILAAQIICLVAGWKAFGPSAGRIAPFAATFALTAIGIFGLFIYALPYWAGITAHDHSGALHALPIAGLGHTLSLEFENLAWGKPGLLSPPALVTAGVLFLAACGLNCAVCWNALSLVRRR